jgi:hypothetical protein
VKKQQHAGRPTTVGAQLTSGMTAAEGTTGNIWDSSSSSRNSQLEHWQ